MSRVIMKKIKDLSVVMMIAAMLGMLAGCGGQSMSDNERIAGHWVLQEQRWGEDYFATREYYEDRGIFEEYYLDEYGGTYYYTTPDEEISHEFTYSYDNKGHFWFDEAGDMYHEVTLDGDTFSYVEGEGDDAITYIFERADD